MRIILLILICLVLIILLQWGCSTNRVPRGLSFRLQEQLPENFERKLRKHRPDSDTFVGLSRVGFDPESKLSMKSYWDESFATNPVFVTNIVQISSNQYSERVRVFFPNKRWGTDEWELLSRTQFEHCAKFNPEISKILEIMKEVPDARNSSRLYTGVYATTFVLNNIHEVVRDSIKVEEQYREELNDPWVTSPNSDPDKRQAAVQMAQETYRFQLAMRRDTIKSLKEDHWRLLKELYGDFPMPLFQHLMAVETLDTF